ncbi:DMT family transporter [Sphingobium baderi]|uniref:Permease n=1 Tax=Sphingobium baderi TaxID=1332080 RepID=A0A0S3EVB0_9SPHN|nr:DMT family transporter [Sphingobium baderi]ALR19374.1 permease [Sphingobium baderi]
MAGSMPMMQKHVPPMAFPALVLANIFLAMGPVLVRLSDVGPIAAAFWRLALATPFLFLLALPRLRTASLGKRQWSLMILAGLFFAADLATWHAGIHHTKVANATMFGNISALVLPLWGLLILRQALHRPQLAALLLALVGGGILMGGSYELSPRYLRGDLLCLMAGLLYTGYLISVQDVRQRLDSWSVLAIASLSGAGPLLIISIAAGEQGMPANWTPLIALALSSQLIGQGLLTYAIGWFSPLVLGLSLMIQPAVSAVVGWLLFDERMSVTDLVGMIAIAAALILVRLPWSARVRDQP